MLEESERGYGLDRPEMLMSRLCQPSGTVSAKSSGGSRAKLVEYVPAANDAGHV